MRETATETPETDATTVHALVGPLDTGGFFALLHRGVDELRTIRGRSYAELHHRMASTAIAHFGMVQEDAEAMATGAVDNLHGKLMNEENAGPVEDPTAGHDAVAIAALKELEGKHAEVTAQHADAKDRLKDQQDEIEVLTAERDKALAEVDTAKAETVALSAELDSTKKTVSDLENRIAAMKDASPASGDGSQTGGASKPLPDAPDPSQGNQTGADTAGAGGELTAAELGKAARAAGKEEPY